MTMHTRTDTFLERCVTAFLSRLDFLGSPGNLTVLSCFKAERGRARLRSAFFCTPMTERLAVLPAARRKDAGSEE